VAGRAARGAVAGKPSVKEELLAEFDLFRSLGIYNRDRDRREGLQMPGMSESDPQTD